MKTIEVSEIEKLDPASVTIIDVRKAEDYARNTIPHAVNIPIETFQEVCQSWTERSLCMCCVIPERKVRQSWSSWRMLAMMR